MYWYYQSYPAYPRDIGVYDHTVTADQNSEMTSIDAVNPTIVIASSTSLSLHFSSLILPIPSGCSTL